MQLFYIGSRLRKDFLKNYALRLTRRQRMLKLQISCKGEKKKPYQNPKTFLLSLCIECTLKKCISSHSEVHRCHIIKLKFICY